jgi:hypothetical protein
MAKDEKPDRRKYLAIHIQETSRVDGKPQVYFERPGLLRRFFCWLFPFLCRKKIEITFPPGKDFDNYDL